MNIKNIDLDYLDSLMDNFDITDSIDYNFDNWINIDNFINFLKREGVYDSIKETIDLYMRFYHKQDKEEVDNYSIDLQEDVITFFEQSINESIMESEEE